MMSRLRILAVVSAAVIALASSQVSSFTPTAPSYVIRSTFAGSSSLYSLIKGEAVGVEPFDENEGGVGLAKRTAVKISGSSSKGKDCVAEELLRYEGMQELEKAVVESILAKAGCQLVCSGTGKELYKDPGRSGRVEDKVVALAPIEAAKDALASAAAVSQDGSQTMVVNFLGGDKLIIGEVMEACDLVVEALDLPAKTKVKFNSISFKEIPEDVCTVTVVASAGGAEGMEGVDESVARGELYLRDGKWYTVAEGDITRDLK